MFGFGRKKERAPQSASKVALNKFESATQPDRLYVIGDIHGHLALLKSLEAQIMEEATTFGDGRATVVYVGDYIDRGPDSAGVLDHLDARAPSGMERIFLCGNHEEAFMDFLETPSSTHPWLNFGAQETLASYGIYPEALRDAFKSQRRLQYLLESFIPSEHRDFLKSLKACAEFPQTFCAHAGVRPDVPLSDQVVSDLFWIRREFLESDADFGKTIVHGHTPADTVEIKANRINVDTGAYDSGVLSCVCIAKEAAPVVLSAQR